MHKFEDFNLDKNLLKAIKNMGYEKPSEVQENVIPLVLKDEDVIVKSQTGSGKTAAFAIPIIENIDIEKNAVQALILTPTRELAVQINEDFGTLGLYKKIKSVPVFGKQPVSLQKTQLKQRVHVVVGTPGRTLDHIESGNLDLSEVKYLVIDEADEMLNMGFIEQVESIICKIHTERQTLMFSATLAEEIKVLIKKHMKNPKIVEIEAKTLTVDKINQVYYEIAEDRKFGLLRDLVKINDINQCIVFCRTKKNVAEVYTKMKGRGYSVCELHGDMQQSDRLDTLKQFKNGEFTFIVATDVAARGIDMSGVTHVINYDIPLELEAYVHRIGRTGRAGRKGEAITFVTPYEEKFLEAIEEFINMNITKAIHPTKEEIEKIPEKQIKTVVKKTTVGSDVIKVYIAGGKRKKIRRGDIVGTIINSCNVPADSIGIIDIFDNYSYVDILNGYGKDVIKNKELPIKGKPMSISKARE